MTFFDQNKNKKFKEVLNTANIDEFLARLLSDPNALADPLAKYFAASPLKPLWEAYSKKEFPPTKVGVVDVLIDTFIDFSLEGQSRARNLLIRAAISGLVKNLKFAIVSAESFQELPGRFEQFRRKSLGLIESAGNLLGAQPCFDTITWFLFEIPTYLELFGVEPDQSFWTETIPGFFTIDDFADATKYLLVRASLHIRTFLTKGREKIKHYTNLLIQDLAKAHIDRPEILMVVNMHLYNKARRVVVATGDSNPSFRKVSARTITNHKLRSELPTRVY